jgi:hypothetical protein
VDRSPPGFLAVDYPLVGRRRRRLVKLPYMDRRRTPPAGVGEPAAAGGGSRRKLPTAGGTDLESRPVTAGWASGRGAGVEVVSCSGPAACGRGRG